jgi:hypothetical protein
VLRHVVKMFTSRDYDCTSGEGPFADKPSSILAIFYPKPNLFMLTEPIFLFVSFRMPLVLASRGDGTEPEVGSVI